MKVRHFYLNLFDLLTPAARVSDILDRYVEDGKLVTVRYSGSKFPVPDIINSTFYRFTGIRFPELAYSYEYSILDLQDKSLKQYSRNTTMSSFLNFTEVKLILVRKKSKNVLADWASCRRRGGNLTNEAAVARPDNDQQLDRRLVRGPVFGHLQKKRRKRHKW